VIKFQKIPGFGAGHTYLYWAILLLVVAVVLPTVCLLWFMGQAVKNERLAVQQKLVDIYSKRAKFFFEEAPDLYFDTEIKHLNSQANAAPYIIFTAFADSSRYSGMLIYGADNKPAYPFLFSLPIEQSDELVKPFQQELSGNFEYAIKQYEALASDTRTEVVRYKAILSKARCLDKLGRKQQAIELVDRLAYPAEPESLRPELAVMTIQARVFLAQLYSQTKDKNLLPYLRRILDAPSFATVPAETIIWQMNKAVSIAESSGLSGELEVEIKSAKHRIEAYQNAIEIASVYPDVQMLSNWPDQTIRRLSPASNLYGLKFKMADKTIIGISSFDKLLNILAASVNDIQDETIAVQVNDNFGRFIAGSKNLASKPFIALSPGRFLPDFKVTVHFKGDSVFENAARKQTDIYIWTGILVVLLILTAGALVARVIGRQIRLNRLKNDFIATVTHELKTPLSSMRVLVDTLLDKRVSDTQQAQEYLELVSKENARLSRLIDNFLTFSRMERNKQAFNMKPAGAGDIAKAAAEAVQAKFINNRCKFTVLIDENLPSISADRDAMITVLVNLLDNACKYSYNDKQIEMRVFTTDGAVCFSVKDNGIGMSRRVIKKIFDKFYQADASLSRRTEGCGLGLSIVKFIVDAHKGTIVVESEPGKGSVFTVKIPAGV
jgi:signal transduction histidine kinase